MTFNKKKIIITSAAIILGAIAGFAYWRFVGCTSGTCPLTSNWYSTVAFGGFFGYLLSDSFKLNKKEEKQTEE